MKIKMNDANKKYLSAYGSNLKKIVTGQKATKIKAPTLKEIWTPTVQKAKAIKAASKKNPR